MRDRCKRCGAERPSQDYAAAASCEKCGAVFGVVPWAQGVVDALERGERPEELPRGVHVDWAPRPRGTGFFRQNEGGVRAHLVIEYHQRGNLWPSLTVAGLVLAAAWLPYRVGVHWWTVAPGLAVIAVAYLILGRLTMRARFTVDDEHLTYAERGHARLRMRTKRLDVRDVRQIYVLERKEPAGDDQAVSALPTYELRARLMNGTSEPIESLINAHLALFYETLLERALGIEDEPVEGELDRPEPRRRVRPAFVFFLLPPALWLGSCAVMGEGYGTLVEPIYLDAGPSEARLHFSTPVTLRFGSWLYFDQEKDVSVPFGSVASLPRATAFAIELRRDGEVVDTLVCDPYDLNGPNFTGADGDYAFFFGGFMRSCSSELPAGTYTLRAEALDREAADPSLVKRRLEPRRLRRLLAP